MIASISDGDDGHALSLHRSLAPSQSGSEIDGISCGLQAESGSTFTVTRTSRRRWGCFRQSCRGCVDQPPSTAPRPWFAQKALLPTAPQDRRYLNAQSCRRSAKATEIGSSKDIAKVPQCDLPQFDLQSCKVRHLSDIHLAGQQSPIVPHCLARAASRSTPQRPAGRPPPPEPRANAGVRTTRTA